VYGIYQKPACIKFDTKTPKYVEVYVSTSVFSQYFLELAQVHQYLHFSNGIVRYKPGF